MEQQAETLNNTVTINMKKELAATLWKLIQGLLLEDARGKKDGSGGIFYPHEIGVYMEVLTNLAEGIDGSK